MLGSIRHVAADCLRELGKGAASNKGAAEAKERGNAAFKDGRLEEALHAYTDALRGYARCRSGPRMHTTHASRAR